MSIDANKKSIRDFVATKLSKKPLREIMTLTAPDGSTVDVEVRQPTAGEWSDIARQAKMSADQRDDMMLNILMCVHCTYVPGTNDRVWGPEDIPVLRDEPVGATFVTAIAQRVGELTNRALEMGKSSAPTASAGSSSVSAAN